jgi:hypothetical protein
MPWRKSNSTEALNFAAATAAFGGLRLEREVNHYGFGLEGLRFQRGDRLAVGIERPSDYYRDYTPCPRGSDRFAAADIWGQGDGTCGNMFGFLGAVDVYRHGTREAIREAMRRVGHALHILQDMGHPDHARGHGNFKCSDLDDTNFLVELATLVTTRGLPDLLDMCASLFS